MFVLSSCVVRRPVAVVRHRYDGREGGNVTGRRKNLPHAAHDSRALAVTPHAKDAVRHRQFRSASDDARDQANEHRLRMEAPAAFAC
ncbi:hypothetical protein [Nonomuraea antimicrobica]|uniref:hypothetical protein n=1 Tax=Nonomuraea antimicrobica TaxID=561173 RepID=UPI0031EC5C0D